MMKLFFVKTDCNQCVVVKRMTNIKVGYYTSREMMRLRIKQKDFVHLETDDR